jgi:MFS family permease
MLCMIAASVPLSGVSFFHPYLFQVMKGTPQATVLLYYTLMMLAIVGSMILIGGPLLPKVGPKPLMIAGSVIVAAALVIFANAHSPAVLYAAGVVLGLGYGLSYQLVPIVWVNNWFVAKKGLVVGLVTGGTGIGGMIWSFMVPALGGQPAPDNESFRMGYYVMAIVVVGLTIPTTLFLAVDKPSDVGLRPLGAPSVQEAVASATSAKPLPGFTFPQAMRSPWLWVIFATSVLLGIVHAAAQIMAPYLTGKVTAPLSTGGLAQPLGYYSVLMMLWTLGLIILKPTLGVLNDRLGVLWAMVITLGMQAAFFLFLPNFGAYGTVVPMIAMFFMSAGMSNGTVQPPLITANAMGPKAFGKIWSVTGTAYTLGMAVGAPIWGLFYDAATKSYARGFYLAPFALAIVIAGAVIGMNAGRRQHLALYEKDMAEAPAAVPVG